MPDYSDMCGLRRITHAAPMPLAAALHFAQRFKSVASI
jgi:hypothetical protein